jgi:hypothetical protein
LQLTKQRLKFVLQTTFHCKLNCIAMKTESSFKKLEKNTFHLYFKDGIFELLFGSIFIIYATNSLFDQYNIEQPLLMRLLTIPVTVVLVLVKQLITTPRLGYVSFSRSRKKKQKWALYVAILAQMIALVAFVLSLSGVISTNDKSRVLSLLIEFLFFILLFGALYYYTGYITFFVVGLIFACSIPLTIFLQPWLHTRNYGYALMATAGVIFLIIGAKKIIVFLQTYPKRNNDE